MTFRQKLGTIWVFFTTSLQRLFRDRMALFFTFLFPLIFLFVFGALNQNNDVSFKVALINQSKSDFSNQFVQQIQEQKVMEVDKSVVNFDQANEKMSRGELDATIELPSNFGESTNGKYPSGEAIIHYTPNSEQAAQTLNSILQAQFKQINSKFVKSVEPFTVSIQRTNERSLNAFDYTFTGILGFAILGAGIFGPMNYFPEMKKMGILRRLRTTPIRVWQYFVANMLSNATTGLMTIAVMIITAVLVFDLRIVGNLFELAVFLAYGIIMILGIGLALGGWAKNERQVAPLGNIIVFPMMFLTGVFFPRFLMPEWLQNITTYVPLTPVIDGTRLILTEGKSLFDLGPQLAIITVWMVIIYIIAFRVFRWE